MLADRYGPRSIAAAAYHLAMRDDPLPRFNADEMPEPEKEEEESEKKKPEPNKQPTANSPIN
jgi:hypothetical protein